VIYDVHAMVDWSAAASPTVGKDSIWIARMDGPDSVPVVKNLPTRLDAVTWLRALLDDMVRDGKRALVGFDFAFGYPCGAAGLMAGENSWDAVWDFMAGQFSDTADNKNARFDVADRLNAEAFGVATEGPFWGHPASRSFTSLKPTKPVFSHFAQHRLVEKRVPSAKSVWQMCYSGAVGGQTMTGIASLQSVRQSHPDHVAIWPFETGFVPEPKSPVTVCEIYPSLLPVAPRAGEVKDAAQVRTMVEHVAALDRDGNLHDWLGAPSGLTSTEMQAVLTEEGWIAGVGY